MQSQSHPNKVRLWTYHPRTPCARAYLARNHAVPRQRSLVHGLAFHVDGNGFPNDETDQYWTFQSAGPEDKEEDLQNGREIRLYVTGSCPPTTPGNLYNPYPRQLVCGTFENDHLGTFENLHWMCVLSYRVFSQNCRIQRYGSLPWFVSSRSKN